MKADPKSYFRRSMRLRGYDYGQNGAYFVTLCSEGRACVFGEIVDSKMRLNACGEAVAETWLWLGRQYSYVVLDAWVVMPNHLHGIIVITDERADDEGGGGSRTATTAMGATPAGGAGPNSGTAPDAGKTPTQPVVRKPLGRLIGAFKTVSTQRMNECRAESGAAPAQALRWQRDFYEHVVRSENELQRIQQYIAENPPKWALDRDNPLCPAGKEEPPPWRQ